MTKKLSQDFSRTIGPILGSSSRLDVFLLYPQIQAHPGPVAKTSQKLIRADQGTNEDHSQNDSHP